MSNVGEAANLSLYTVGACAGGGYLVFKLIRGKSSEPKRPRKYAAIGAGAGAFLGISSQIREILYYRDSADFEFSTAFAVLAISFLFSTVLFGAAGLLIGIIFDFISRKKDLRDGDASIAAAKPTPTLNAAIAASRATTPDPYEVAGDELLSGKVKPGAWARALAAADGEENLQKAEYVRLRVAELNATDAAATVQAQVHPSPVFGYSALEPVFCRSSTEEEEYISRIQRADGGRIKASRAGTVKSESFDRPINKWFLEMPDGLVRALYVHAQHDTLSREAPRVFPVSTYGTDLGL